MSILLSAVQYLPSPATQRCPSPRQLGKHPDDVYHSDAEEEEGDVAQVVTAVRKKLVSTAIKPTLSPLRDISYGCSSQAVEPSSFDFPFHQKNLKRHSHCRSASTEERYFNSPTLTPEPRLRAKALQAQRFERPESCAEVLSSVDYNNGYTSSPQFKRSSLLSPLTYSGVQRSKSIILHDMPLSNCSLAAAGWTTEPDQSAAERVAQYADNETSHEVRGHTPINECAPAEDHAVTMICAAPGIQQEIRQIGRGSIGHFGWKDAQERLYAGVNEAGRTQATLGRAYNTLPESIVHSWDEIRGSNARSCVKSDSSLHKPNSLFRQEELDRPDIDHSASLNAPACVTTARAQTECGVSYTSRPSTNDSVSLRSIVFWQRPSSSLRDQAPKSDKKDLWDEDGALHSKTFSSRPHSRKTKKTEEMSTEQKSQTPKKKQSLTFSPDTIQSANDEKERKGQGRNFYGRLRWNSTKGSAWESNEAQQASDNDVRLTNGIETAVPAQSETRRRKEDRPIHPPSTVKTRKVASRVRLRPSTSSGIQSETKDEEDDSTMKKMKRRTSRSSLNSTTGTSIRGRKGSMLGSLLGFDFGKKGEEAPCQQVQGATCSMVSIPQHCVDVVTFETGMSHSSSCSSLHCGAPQELAGRSQKDGQSSTSSLSIPAPANPAPSKASQLGRNMIGRKLTMSYRSPARLNSSLAPTKDVSEATFDDTTLERRKGKDFSRNEGISIFFSTFSIGRKRSSRLASESK